MKIADFCPKMCMKNMIVTNTIFSSSRNFQCFFISRSMCPNARKRHSLLTSTIPWNIYLENKLFYTHRAIGVIVKTSSGCLDLVKWCDLICFCWWDGDCTQLLIRICSMMSTHRAIQCIIIYIYLKYFMKYNNINNWNKKLVAPFILAFPWQVIKL